MKDNISVILGVLTDWRVILTCICTLLVISFAKFIINYRKKPPKPKGKKAPSPKPEPAQASGEESGGQE